VRALLSVNRPFQAQLHEVFMVRHPAEVQQAIDAYTAKSTLTDEELAWAIQRDWLQITQHCRGTIPESRLLLYRFDQLIVAYSTITDATTGT
jgi:hypothetical protein